MNQFVKLYAEFWASSIREESPTTRLFFIALIGLANSEGIVRGTSSYLAAHANLPLADVRAALESLQLPDPESTSTNEGGRRLVREGPNEWRIVNYRKYYERQKIEKRRSDKAESEQSRRDRIREESSTSVHECPRVSTPFKEENRIEETKREEKNIPPNPPRGGKGSIPKTERGAERAAAILSVLPAEFESHSGFVTALKAHCELHPAIPKPRSLPLVAKKFEAYGPATMQIALEASAVNGWEGVFPESVVAPNGASKRKFGETDVRSIHERL